MSGISRVNFRKIEVNRIGFWFSYSTIVAVMENGKLYVSENRWGTTTGKHLNYLDGGDRKNRFHKGAFEDILEEICDRNGINKFPSID